MSRKPLMRLASKAPRRFNAPVRLATHNRTVVRKIWRATEPKILVRANHHSAGSLGVSCDMRKLLHATPASPELVGVIPRKTLLRKRFPSAPTLARPLPLQVRRCPPRLPLPSPSPRA